MTFQGYLETIKERTGRTPADFRRLAEAKGFTEEGRLKVKAGDIVAWLKTEYGLGHGHAMAIYALLSGKKSEDGL